MYHYQVASVIFTATDALTFWQRVCSTSGKVPVVDNAQRKSEQGK